MPGTVPAGDETLLYALPEDQPDSLSEGHKSKQADLDLNGVNVVKGEDPVVTSEADEPKPAKKAAPRKSSK